MNGAAPTDLVVVLPGITGSALYKNDKPVWEPSAGAIVNALLTLGRSISSLKLPGGIGDQAPDDGVYPGGLINDVHVIPGLWTPIRGYSPLIAKLEGLGYRAGTAERPGNLLPMPYDWRLSNRYTASWMAPAIQEALDRWRAQGGRFSEAQVVFVCHSMGGLVARWYATHHGRDHTRMIITFGTPMRGSMNALDNLVHGTATKLGPLGRKFTAVSRSLPSLHQLLPAYACVVEGNAEPDYLDPASLPDIDAGMARDGLDFYEQLETAEAGFPGFADLLHPIVGTNQPTASTVRVSGGTATILHSYPDTQDATVTDYFGDATVPLVAAIPRGLRLNTNVVRRVPDIHGNLQRNTAALDELEGVLTATPVVIKGPEVIALSLDAPEILTTAEPLHATVSVPPGTRTGLRATLHPTDAADARRDTTRVLRLVDGVAHVSFEGLAPGAYTLTVAGTNPGSAVAPVTGTAVVWDPTTVIPD